MKQLNSEQNKEETDGVGTDSTFQIEIKISECLKENIDSLNLPIVLKNALKKIKSLFIPQTKEQEKEQNAKETSEASREGRKEQ